MGRVYGREAGKMQTLSLLLIAKDFGRKIEERGKNKLYLFLLNIDGTRVWKLNWKNTNAFLISITGARTE